MIYEDVAPLLFHGKYVDTNASHPMFYYDLITEKEKLPCPQLCPQIRLDF